MLGQLEFNNGHHSTPPSMLPRSNRIALLVVDNSLIGL